MSRIYRILRIPLIAYLGVCLVLLFFENKLVYHPLTASQSWEKFPGMSDVELVAADGNKLHAWWLPCDGSDTALIYLHGNGGNLSHRGGSCHKLRELLKASILIVDYPGYGKSEGRPSEAGCYAAADAGYDWITKDQKILPENVLIYGASLGGGVAVDLASRKPHRALILVKTFSSLPDVAGFYFPWLPTRLLMRNRFDSVNKIDRCTRPKFFCHGTLDRIVPYASGMRLFEAAPDPKHFCTLIGDDHDDSIAASCYQSLVDFLKANP